MQNQYETVFILTPVLSEQQIKETVGKFRNYLKDRGAEMVHEESWGIRKLAYQINHKSTGYYHLFEYKVAPNVIADFELQLRRDERVMRFLTVKLDKYAIEYNEKRRKKLQEKSAEPKLNI